MILFLLDIMATAKTIETYSPPLWSISRAVTTYSAKHMDQDALVPFDQLSPAMQRRQKGRWLAYTYTLEDPKRAYVYQAAVNVVRLHTQGINEVTVVDLGAGNGRNTIKTARILDQRVPTGLNHLYLIEQSGAALDEARKYFCQNGFPEIVSLRSKTYVHFRQGDIANTDLPDQSADAITCVNVFHHAPTWEKLMGITDEIDRILKPGGVFVVVDTRPLPPQGFKRKMIENSIRRAVDPGKFEAKALAEGLNIGQDEKLGIRDFCLEDALKAFENALTKNQFEETLKKSALSESLQEVADLCSSHPILRVIYPPMNFAWGKKR